MGKIFFEWDGEKAEKNLEKHKVSFEEAATIFDDPSFITVLDEGHSYESGQSAVGSGQ